MTMRTKTTFQEKLPLILAFVIPILIMLGIFAGKEIYPFGDNCFLRTDLYHQYIAFFEDLGDRLREGKGLLYAFDIGLGSNYSALFAYYLCGPLHLFAFLIPTEYMIEFITFLIVLKIGLCGWAMAWYLSKRFKTRHYGIAICGICYALSGYLAAYSWNIMWLDVLWIALFAIYGLEQLVKENKPFLYCISLALAILCNYYISIMLCAFLLLYFFNRLIALSPFSWKQLLRKVCTFAFFSLLAGAMAAVLVLPAAYALQGTASAGSTFPRTLTNYFSIFEMLSRHLVVVNCEIGLDHWPNIYSGVLVFLLIPLYYMNKKVSFREKIANTILLGFLLLSFNMNMLDFMWHGFHYPNSLPCRFSFLYTFLITVMCFEGIRKAEMVRKEILVRIMWAAIGLILVAELVNDSAEIPYYACYASIAFIALYTLFAYLRKAGYIERGTAFALILCVLIIEMGLNTAVTSVSYVKRSDFMMFNDSFDQLVAKAEEGKTFTRVERQFIRTKNDGVYFGYNSASIFSSTTNKAISDFYRRVGLEGNTNAYAITGATPFMWSFLGIEYKLTDNRLPTSPIYELVDSAPNRKNGTNYLYRNLYTLPLGYLVPEDVADLWHPTTSNPAKSQNSYANLAAGISNVFESVTPNISGSEMLYTVDRDGHYYAHITGSVRKVTATINDEKSKVWDSLDRNYMVDFGYVQTGDVLKLVAAENGNINGTMHYLNVDNFIKFHEKLSANPLQITEFTDKTFKTQISGYVDAEKDSLLVYSIPLEKGWTAQVDGQNTELTPLDASFIAIKVPAGHHEVVIRYVPEGLKLGLLLSLGGLAIFLILLAVSLLIKAKRKKTAEEDPNGPEEPLPALMTEGEDALPVPLSKSGDDSEGRAVVPSAAVPLNVSGRERLEAMHRLDEEERLREGSHGIIFEDGEAKSRYISPAEMQEDERLLTLPDDVEERDAASDPSEPVSPIAGEVAPAAETDSLPDAPFTEEDAREEDLRTKEDTAPSAPDSSLPQSDVDGSLWKDSKEELAEIAADAGEDSLSSVEDELQKDSEIPEEIFSQLD